MGQNIGTPNNDNDEGKAEVCVTLFADEDPGIDSRSPRLPSCRRCSGRGTLTIARSSLSRRVYGWIGRGWSHGCWCGS